MVSLCYIHQAVVVSTVKGGVTMLHTSSSSGIYCQGWCHYDAYIKQGYLLSSVVLLCYIHQAVVVSTVKGGVTMLHTSSSSGIYGQGWCHSAD